jgi:ElaB/YqjD/DUF883 family membrane-anchored ribosome-binding protein
VDQRPRAVTPERRREEAIVAHIEAERMRLGENIQQLRAHLGDNIHDAGERVGRVTDRARDFASRARQTADPRTWIRERPLLLVGISFLVGFWLAFGGRRRC